MQKQNIFAYVFFMFYIIYYCLATLAYLTCLGIILKYHKQLRDTILLPNSLFCYTLFLLIKNPPLLFVVTVPVFLSNDHSLFIRYVMKAEMYKLSKQDILKNKLRKEGNKLILTCDCFNA